MARPHRPAKPSRKGTRLRIRVFLSYAHRDEKLRDDLDKHLSVLRRSAVIESWHDRRINPGVDLDHEVDRHLATSDLILLLISPDFMNSDYCYRREMRTALKRHAKGQARVIPIVLRPVDWLRTTLGRLLALPTDGRPVTSWHRRDDALLNVAKGVRRAAEEIGWGRQQDINPSQIGHTRKLRQTEAHA
jgi:hypothetical protein